MKSLAIVGAGGWGTALAIVLAPRFDQVRLWSHRTVFENRENIVYLPGFPIPSNVLVTNELCAALTSADIVVGVTPSHHLRRVFREAAPDISHNAICVSASKGLERDTLLRMSQVLGEEVRAPIVVLSGPTFAREVAAGEPALVVVSSLEEQIAREVQHRFSGPSFRLYTNPDPVGVEIGAALKNVIAIGAGICKGLGLGSNVISALITRGLAEISRLALALGGEQRTLAGLAGLGDLVLTCTGELSRNRQVGIELGRGRQLSAILESMRMVAEGVQTTYAAVDLSNNLEIEMPIVHQMNAILRLGKSPMSGIRELMERSLKGE